MTFPNQSRMHLNSLPPKYFASYAKYDNNRSGNSQANNTQRGNNNRRGNSRANNTQRGNNNRNDASQANSNQRGNNNRSDASQANGNQRSQANSNQRGNNNRSDASQANGNQRGNNNRNDASQANSNERALPEHVNDLVADVRKKDNRLTEPWVPADWTHLASKRVQGVLKADNRSKLERFLFQTQRKHTELFKTKEGWPRLFTYIMAINEIVPNVSGTEERNIVKKRVQPQVIVLPLTKTDKKTELNYFKTYCKITNCCERDTGWAKTPERFMELLNTNSKSEAILRNEAIWKHRRLSQELQQQLDNKTKECDELKKQVSNKNKDCDKNKECDELKKELKRIKKTCVHLSVSMGKLENEKKELENEKDALSEEVETLKKQLSELQSKQQGGLESDSTPTLQSSDSEDSFENETYDASMITNMPDCMYPLFHDYYYWG